MQIQQQPAITGITTPQSVRKVLYDELVKLNPDKDWSFVTSQIGMFSFTGMTPKQVWGVVAIAEGSTRSKSGRRASMLCAGK